MDDIKRPKIPDAYRPRMNYLAAHSDARVRSATMPRLRALSAGLTSFLTRRQPVKKTLEFDWERVALVLSAVALIFGVILPTLDYNWQKDRYNLSNSELSLVGEVSQLYANKLVYDQGTNAYQFNADYNPLTPDAQSSGGARVKATLYIDPTQGTTITDPESKVSLGLTPTFKLLDAKNSDGRVIYPLVNQATQLVYTPHADGLKEDIVLPHYQGDSLAYSYTLNLPAGTEARLNADGSIGIWGVAQVLLGNVNTSDARDAALLQKARTNSAKTNLLFTLPAPVIKQSGRGTQGSKAWFELQNGTHLTVHASGLRGASYPLSIDPTVTVNSAVDFLRDANSETNVDFDSTNNLIKRGALTGGMPSGWSGTANNLNTARFLQATAVNNGYIYVAGGAGANSTSNLTSVEFAQLNTSTGNTSGAWVTGAASGAPPLPVALSRFQLIAYNGYLYAIGGSTTDTTCTTVTNTVYYIRIQENGQLASTWNTTSTIPTVNSVAGRCSFGAAVYNGKLYIAGGRTGSANTTGTTDVSYTTINPDGSLSSWTQENSVLPGARYGNDLQAYNGYLYVIGGNLNGTVTGTVLYAPVASDGTVYGSSSASWLSAPTLPATSTTTIRENLGSTFSAVMNGFMYVSGGCSVLNANQSCSTIQGTTELARINADGSLGQWTDGGVTLSRVGASLTVWDNNLYMIAGCTSMNSGSISCATGAPTLATQQFTGINAVGSVGSTKSGTSGSVTYTNTLPANLYDAGVVVNNGFIYVVGGCITTSCEVQFAVNTSQSTYYAPINADGTLGSWTQDTHTINHNNNSALAGIAATTVVASNNILYALGGAQTNSSIVGYSQIWTVSVNSNGSLAANWAQNSTALRNASYYSSAMIYKGNIYVFGGCHQNSNFTFGCYSSFYFTNVDTYSINGTTIGSATSTGATSQLPSGTLNYPNAMAALAFYDNYVYLCGGQNSNSAANGGVQIADCIYNKINANGTITTSWSVTSGSFNQTILDGSAAVMNGYLYVIGGYNGQTSTVVSDVNVGKINPSTGDIASFSLSGVAITARWGVRSIFANGNIYAIGGCTAGSNPIGCSTLSGLTEYMEVYNGTSNVTRGYTANTTSYSTNRTGASAAIYNGYIYVAGGCTAYTVSTATCTAAASNFDYAPLNPDGSIGTWTAATALPAVRTFGTLVAVNGYLYFMGGQDSTPTIQSTVYKSTIGSNGAPGAFSSTGQTALPAVRTSLSATTFNGYIYVTGGYDGSTYQTTTWHSTINGSGDITAWNTDTAFTGGRRDHASAAAGGYLYILGGYNGTNFLMDVQFIQLNNATGATTGSWTNARDLPRTMRQFSAIAANGYLYTFGGATGTSSTSCLSTTYMASINGAGYLSDWQQGTATSFPAELGAAVAYGNGYFYVAGGDNCTSIITSNVIQYSGEQSQTMSALYTRYIDFGSNATPRQILIDGTNAAIGGTDIDKWKLVYKSALNTGSAPSWGASTTISPLSFGGLSSNLTAINSSSINQGVSEWWELAFSIDMTQSFSFTDDTQPTITDYTFYYSPGASTRLRNGQTFQDQTLQSLDAHP